MTIEGAPRYGASELGRLLIAPDAGQQFSPVDGPGALIIDLAVTTEADRDCALLLEQLPTFPCVTIAIEPEASNESSRAIGLACDVLLRADDDVDAFLSGFVETKLAALAFVQLLRTSNPQSVYAGLVAESFVYSMLQSGPEFQSWLARLKRRRGRQDQMSDDSGPACRLERREERLDIVLSRPLRHNAFSRAMRDALSCGLDLALADASIERVVLRGDGASFCSGGDLTEFGTLNNPVQAHAIRTTRSPALGLSRLADRVTAIVHGACIGAGIELPAFCSRISASEDTRFSLPEISMGLIPGAGGTVSLPRRIGRQKTAWLGLSGRRIDAQTALDWGLVDEIRLGINDD